MLSCIPSLLPVGIQAMRPRFSGSEQSPVKHLNLTEVHPPTLRDIPDVWTLTKQFFQLPSTEILKATTVFSRLVTAPTPGEKLLLLRNKAQELVACGAICHETNNREAAQMFNICVAEKFQGLGLGRWITQQLVESAYRMPGVNWVFLFAENPIAISLYKSLGFQHLDLANYTPKELAKRPELRHYMERDL